MGPLLFTRQISKKKRGDYPVLVGCGEMNVITAG